MNHKHLEDADTATLQEVIRLHNKQCVVASRLNSYIAAKHKLGKPGTIPGTEIPLTESDLIALRGAMRRKDPAYKIPRLKHNPPPPEWQLYISQDERSGPKFATVAFVDTTKALQTPTGYKYDDTALRIQLGFIPAFKPPGAVCSPQQIVDLLEIAAKAGILIVSAPGGWTSAVSGLPASKSVWQSADAGRRMNRLYADLTKLVT